MRRLLSYHIMSQVGYMTVAIGIGTAAGVTGAFAHLTANVLYKGLLFMVAGAIIVRTGEASLKRLGGLASAMPLTFVTFLIAALAITGVPGFSGFVSKGLVTKAVESAGGDLLWWALVVGGVGTVLSFVKFGYYAFVRRASEPRRVAPASPALSLSLVVIAVPSVAFGVFPEAFLGAFAGDPGGFAPYATSELTKAVAVVAVGIVAFAALRRPLGRVPVVDVDRILHPLAARFAAATSAFAVRVGVEAGLVRSRAVDRLGSVVGRDSETADTALHAAIGALVATAALALVVATLA
jgi:multicomponent Na+:H+ antiporter subunit D